MRKALLRDVASINPRPDDIPAQARVSFVGMAELDSVAAAAVPRETREFAEVSKGYTVFRNRDILAAKITPCWENGKVGQALLEHAFGAGSTEFHVIRPGEGLDARYLLHFLRQPRVKIAGEVRMTGSGGQKRVPASFLANLSVPLPALPEQRRIAAILDQADAIRTKRRRMLARLDSLAQSIFHEMFGDPATNPRSFDTATIRSLAEKFSDGPFGSNLKSSHYTSDGVAVIRLQNIGVGRYLTAERAFVSKEHYSGLEKHDCRPGDVLIATLGDPNLRACIQPDSLPIALNKADCIQFRVNEQKADPVWACWLLNMPGTLSLASSLAHGQTRTRIAMGQLRDLLVPVPPVEDQREFARRVMQIDTKRQRVEQALAVSDELFSSLQSQAFRGEL